LAVRSRAFGCVAASKVVSIMEEASQYLEDIKSKLIASSLITEFVIIEELDLVDRGYFRARITLSNNDFLEVAEYFKIEQSVVTTKRYRYQ
jgi:hypothetical protein